MKRISETITITGPGQLTELTVQVPYKGKITRAKLTATMKGTKLYPTFYGTGTAGLGEAGVKALDSRLVPAGRQELRFSPVMERFYFAFPASFGALIAVFDQNGYEMLAAFQERTEVYTMADGQSIMYRIYESRDDTTQDNFLLKFIF